MSVSVPIVVGVLIALVGSAPIETVATISPVTVLTRGPSMVVGKSVVLMTNALFDAVKSEGSYLIATLTVETAFVPGLMTRSKETVSPICFCIGVVVVELGEKESVVAAVARLLSSCCC